LQKLGLKLIPLGATWNLGVRSGDLPTQPLEIETYKDHRMAMAFSLLATKQPLFIDDIECVEKSFPQFWKALQSCNFELNLIENEPK
jgi:3-phosphoshikimate 1-carboxyvinyltransferase